MSYKFENRENLHEAIILWNANKDKALNIYGDINSWDLSKIPNMPKSFSYRIILNGNGIVWDVTNAISMQTEFLMKKNRKL